MLTGRVARAASGLVAASLLAVAALGCDSTVQRSASTSTTSTTTASEKAAAQMEQVFVHVVAEVRPQVVQISTGSGLGSGVLYDNQGDIVTNYHVVGTAATFTVQLFDGRELPAVLVGAYPPDDLAVIRVSGARDLSPATFGSSAGLQVGEIVFAVGNPLGLSSSVTEGIVSYNGRTVSEGNGIELPSAIQTSAAINPGNSGGALVDLSGQVVGIPTLGAVNTQAGGAAAGIGFAIPSDTVKLIVPQLIANGRVTRSDRAALGIQASDAVDRNGTPVGAIVEGVTPGGPAAQAGIAAGELINSLAGREVRSLADLQGLLAQLQPGARVQLRVVGQDGGSRTVSVVLGQLAG